MHPAFAVHVPQASADSFDKLTEVRMHHFDAGIDKGFQVRRLEQIHQQVALGLSNHYSVVSDQIRVLHHRAELRFQFQQRLFFGVLHGVLIEQLHGKHLVALLVHDFPDDPRLPRRDRGNEDVVIDFALVIRVV